MALRLSLITESAFAARRQRDWEELHSLTKRAVQRGLTKLTPEEIARVSPLYRDVCGDLSRAQAARYSAPLVEYLQGLTAAGHTLVYGSHARARRGGDLRARASDAVRAFPRAVRAHWGAVLIAFVLFFAPFVGGLLGTLHDPSFAFHVVPEGMLRPLTEAYAKGFNDGRGAGEDAMMAGFYVQNNVGIALRCFALGIFGGVGSAFYLVENGLSIGAVLGYVASQGAGENILTFVVGHGSLELGAIVLAGGAGLAMGWSIVAPGEITRLASLQSVARDVVVIVFGAAVMLLGAAAIEGFWSASAIPIGIKRSVGATMFVLVMAYLLLVGRGAQRKPGVKP